MSEPNTLSSPSHTKDMPSSTPQMLVHICCSVDSHYFLSELAKLYPHHEMIGYFYNPNIHPKSEYDLRLSDVKRSCEMLKIKLLEGEYELEQWLCGVKGLEDEPEKGERCVKCFDLRLEKTAQVAQSLKISSFTSTLLSSPLKEQHILFKEGDEIAKGYGLNFIKVDVRSNGGTQRQSELANKDKLYKQNYCGCNFALTKQRESKGQLVLEMMSDIGKQILPGSNEQRKEVFAKRIWCEQNGYDYLLHKRSVIIWRDLRSFCLEGGRVIDSYIITHSRSKNNTRTGGVVYMKLLSLESHTPITIGRAKKDESILLQLSEANKLLGSHYKNVREMVYNPPSFEQEMRLRGELCGRDSISPIVVLDTQYPTGIRLSIDSVFQKSDVYAISIAQREG